MPSKSSCVRGSISAFPLEVVGLLGKRPAFMWRSLLVAVVLSLISGGVDAHPLVRNSMWVVFAPDRVRVAVNVSLKEIAISQQLPAEPEVPMTREEAEAAAKKNADYVVRHLSVVANAQELLGKVVSVTPPPLYGGNPEQTLFQYELEYTFSGGGPPARVVFKQDMLREFPYAVGQSWDVTYVMRLKRSDQTEVSTGLLRWNTAQEFVTGWQDSSTSGQTATGYPAWDYLRHGIMHILTGYDHLLFVSALVLATLSFWEMFKVIAAFTLAHTITLAVSTLTGFRLPDSIVEPVIAGSIVVVALQNVLAPRRSRGWLRLVIAFGFGLVHGLGFAGGLRDAMSDLGMQSMIVALIAFSVGVEIGHQLVVLPLFGFLKLGEWKFQPAFRATALRYGSLAISLAGTYYLCAALRVV